MRWLFSKLSSECQSTPDDEEAKWGALAHCSAPQIGASSEIDEPPQRPPAFGSNDVLKTRAVPAATGALDGVGSAGTAVVCGAPGGKRKLVRGRALPAPALPAA